MNTGIKQKIKDHIVETWLNGDDRDFTDKLDLQAMGVLDSFSTLSLASFLEDTFSVLINPVDINAESFKSVESIAALIASKQ